MQLLYEYQLQNRYSFILPNGSKWFLANGANCETVESPKIVLPFSSRSVSPSWPGIRSTVKRGGAMSAGQPWSQPFYPPNGKNQHRYRTRYRKRYRVRDECKPGWSKLRPKYSRIDRFWFGSQGSVFSIFFSLFVCKERNNDNLIITNDHWW